MKNIGILLKLIGEAFKEERTIRNITQKQMAEKVGCSESEYKAIEAGRKNMNLALFLRICGSFEHIKIGELFENVGISFDADYKVGKHGKKLTYFMDYFESEFEIVADYTKKKKQDKRLQSLFDEAELR